MSIMWKKCRRGCI